MFGHKKTLKVRAVRVQKGLKLIQEPRRRPDREGNFERADCKKIGVIRRIWQTLLKNLLRTRIL
jgi:hypothetical protein